MPAHFHTVNDILAGLGRPVAPRVIDVRTDADFDTDLCLVPGAVRWPHTDSAALARHLAGAPAAIVCHAGLKLSQGVAAHLRLAGCPATHVAGGMVAWRAAKAPVMAAAALPARTADGVAVWSAPDDPDLTDRAAVWLVRRLIDPSAQVLYVARSQVAAVADRFDAACVRDPSETCLADVAARFGLTHDPIDAMSNDLLPANAGWLSRLADGLARCYPDPLSCSEADLALFDGVFCAPSLTKETPT